MSMGCTETGAELMFAIGLYICRAGRPVLKYFMIGTLRQLRTAV